ncbi:Wzz/FepE/Etk N-terminal domain-containing protein [Brevibacillus ruminantium]|uniref:Wzz/FepE/Etk N-terminal domain-containing protein n=1 Tax=Brevibacillus ruminantium TaxID=2950604 RepID=A0ABY4WJC1_9BACL|nr:Wzz/FepE/Etk N-terminal domain-containing protein [Brevibacillus ruminantium]USG67128.1 Wzz/FepE/Etk N-terminal domain-containing protein [Brevibacillus ruminantium]
MEMELADVRRILRRNAGMILLVVVVCVVVAGLISFFVLKPVYEAKATLLVKKQQSGGQLAYEDLMTSEKLVKTYGEIMKSRLVVEDVIAKLKVNESVTNLLKRVEVKTDNESLMTAVVVRDTDPVRAVRIANELARISMVKWNQLMEMDSVILIDPAEQEDSQKPVQPRPYLNMLLSFVLSLMAGIAFAFLREFLHKTVETEEELEALLGMPVLGIVPVMKRSKKFIRKAG